MNITDSNRGMYAKGELIILKGYMTNENQKLF